MAKKYIDADRLIEGLKELESVVYSGQLLGQSMDRYDRGQLRAINNMKELVNSLQQEQFSEDLEKEMERFLSNITPAFKDGSYKITRLGFRAVARHFYEFGKNSK